MNQIFCRYQRLYIPAVSLLLVLLVCSPLLAELETESETLEQVATYTALIQKYPDQAVHYVKRGDAYYLLHNYDAAVADFTAAIKLDDSFDDAYYGYGMAYGRHGLIDEGIADLGVFIQRNPEISLAYTKRGVRYLWKLDGEYLDQVSLHPIATTVRTLFES